jgi:hypothetical protein
MEEQIEVEVQYSIASTNDVKRQSTLPWRVENQSTFDKHTLAFLLLDNFSGSFSGSVLGSFSDGEPISLSGQHMLMTHRKERDLQGLQKVRMILPAIKHEKRPIMTFPSVDGSSVGSINVFWNIMSESSR